MGELWLKDLNINDTYEQVEKIVNQHIDQSMLIFRKLVEDADNETWDIIFNCILSTSNLTIEKNNNDETFVENLVLSNFYVGGIISYLLWHAKKNFPSDIPFMNKSFYKIIHEFQDFNQKRDKIGDDL